MNKLTLVLLAMPAAALGDDPFACVDPEVADAFLGSTYSTDLPEALSGLLVPDSLALVGSESNDFYQRAVFKTAETSDGALTSAVDRIAGAEWQRLSNYSGIPSGGFQRYNISPSATLCRDAEPSLLSISARSTSGRTYLTYSLNTYGESPACSELESQSATRLSPIYNFDKLPTLELPDDVKSTNAGMGGGGNEYHSSVTVKSGMSRDSLVTYLGDQIRDQGWVFDSGWAGNYSAGSVWSKKSPDGKTLIGTLHAYGESRDSYDVRFAVTSGRSGMIGGVSLIGNAVLPAN